MSQLKTRTPIFWLLSCFLLFSLVTLHPAAAKTIATGPAVTFEDHHDSSPLLRDMVRTAPSVKQFSQAEEAPGEEARKIPARRNFPDPVLQRSADDQVGTVTGLNFAGVGEGDYGFHDIAAAPDATGAAGKTQYVQVVNSAFAIFNKSSGNLIIGPASINSIWQGFGGACEHTLIADPVAQYDRLADRWLLVGQAERLPSGEAYAYVCVAVSQSSDATGAYNRYAMHFDAIDYQKLGVWPDAYYLGLNGLLNRTAISCAMDRAAMLKGEATKAVCFTYTGLHTLLPADLDGRVLPPSGAPNYFVGGINSQANVLNLFKFHADFANPSHSTFTGPSTIQVAAYEPACSQNGPSYYRACVQQKGTKTELETLSDRLMYRNAYRNFGDHESIMVTHSVNTGDASGPVGVRWYELRAAEDGNFSVFQQGTYAPDLNSRWMASAAMDKAGDIAVGYAVSSSTMYPSIRYAGRIPTDPLGVLKAEKSIMAGESSTSNTMWGDYNNLSIDPGDDCTFWYTNQYYKADAGTDWSTRIASFKFKGCN